MEQPKFNLGARVRGLESSFPAVVLSARHINDMGWLYVVQESGAYRIYLESELQLDRSAMMDKPRSEVISEPGAAITVTRFNLTDEEREGLTVGVRLSDIKLNA